MADERELKMSVDLSVIEHLGMNLYSNTPAVLSEIVANAWDADAQNVSVEFGHAKDTIKVRDDGVGMSRDQVIDQYLMVGFRRREQLGPLTKALNRQPMGRKGIGKLSCFSIADTVSVFTSQNGQKTAFLMNAGDIRESLADGDERTYRPTNLEDWPEDFDQDGTFVILSDLKRNVTQLSVKNLRQRIARRFSVLGASHHFTMNVNGEEVTVQDRGYLDKLEFLWVYDGEMNQQFEFNQLSNVKRSDNRTEEIATGLADESANISISGWLGTVRNPGQLKDEGGQNLNRIAIYMRGKMSQEDILADIGDKRLYADYLVGEIYCEELDVDAQNDIATSSRQDLKSDDPRFVALRAAVQRELTHIHGKWSAWRTEDGAKRLVQGVPEVQEWLSQLEGDTQKKAQKWIGRLNLIRSDKDSTRRELLKGSILAFESYRRREQLDFLAEIDDEDIEKVLQVFDDIDELQLSYYGQIVNLRLAVVRTLQEKLDEDDYEKALQKHIYNHLWLIDPSWERVPGTEAEERSLGAFLKADTKGLDEAERRARIDIGYRTATGRHVIIELKRNSISVPVDLLAQQIRKYRDGAKSLISRTQHKDWPLEIICLVGKPPPEWRDGTGRADVEETLAAVDARLVFYDELLSNAYQAYEDYLESHKKVDRLWHIFRAIENFEIENEP